MPTYQLTPCENCGSRSIVFRDTGPTTCCDCDGPRSFTMEDVEHFTVRGPGSVMLNREWSHPIVVRRPWWQRLTRLAFGEPKPDPLAHMDPCERFLFMRAAPSIPAGVLSAYLHGGNSTPSGDWDVSAYAEVGE